MSEDTATDQINMDSNGTNPDPKAIEEALAKIQEGGVDEPRTVHVACRRAQHLNGRPGSSSGDQDLQNPCDGNKAQVMSDVMPHTSKGQTVYRCTTCGYTWSITTGSHINI